MRKYLSGEKRIKTKEIRELLILNDFYLARKKINEYIDLYGEDCYIKLEKAKYYRNMNDIESAIRIYNEIIDNGEKNASHAMYDLGKIYESNSQIDKAIEIYRNMLTMEYYKKDSVYLSLGNLYCSQNEYDKAEIYLRKAFSYHNDKSDFAKILLSEIFIIKNNYNEAFKLLNSINNDDKKIKCKALLCKAELDKAIGNNFEYKKIIDEIITKYDKECVPALIEKIQILCDENKYSEAKKVFNTIKGQLNNSLHTQIVLANYFKCVDEEEKAKEIYLKLSEANIEFSNICLAQIEMKNGNYESATKYLSKNLENMNDYYVESILHLAYIDILNNNYEHASKHLQMIGTTSIKPSINNEIERIKLILDIKLNKMTVLKDYTSYALKQIVQYDEKKAIEHIMKHTKENVSVNESYFNPDVDIESLYHFAKEQLIPENIFNVGIAIKYKIPYENVGIIDDQKMDYLVVVTNIGTKDIITMYPSDKYGEEQFIEEKPKQKTIQRKSQIEKFNEKYNLKN